mgnify:CR=1 FL=1
MEAFKPLSKNCWNTDQNELDIDLLKKADIIMIGVGNARLIKKHMIKEGAILIDIGINALSS